MTRQIKTPIDQLHRPCVVVSDRPWNKGLSKTLTSRTDRDFLLITQKEDLSAEKLALINPEFIFFPHWSHHIASNIYEKFQCIIFHMTDVPFGRGGSPLQNLIARGMSETKISALQCVEELDAGPVYLKKRLELHGSAEEIFLRTSQIIEEMIVEILETKPKPKPQEGYPTVFKRRKPADGDLSKACSLEQIYDLIRMLDADGYPQAFLNVGQFKFEFTRVSMKTDKLLADVRIQLIKEGKTDD